MRKRFNTLKEVAASFWQTNDISLYIDTGSKQEYNDEPVH